MVFQVLKIGHISSLTSGHDPWGSYENILIFSQTGRSILCGSWPWLSQGFLMPVSSSVSKGCLRGPNAQKLGMLFIRLCWPESRFWVSTQPYCVWQPNSLTLFADFRLYSSSPIPQPSLPSRSQAWNTPALKLEGAAHGDALLVLEGFAQVDSWGPELYLRSPSHVIWRSGFWWETQQRLPAARLSQFFQQVKPMVSWSGINVGPHESCQCTDLHQGLCM